MSRFITATPSILYLHVADAAWKGVDFAPLLTTGVTLSGGAAITLDPTSGLAVSSVQVNASAFSDADADVPPIAANKGVIGKFDPAAAGEGDYDAVFEADTSDSQHLAVRVILRVES